MDVSDQSAVKSQHRPAAGIAEFGASAIGSSGQIERCGNRAEDSTGQHHRGVDEMRADVAESAGAPLQPDASEFAQFTGGDATLHLAKMRMKTSVVVDGQQGAGLPTRGEHPLGIGQACGDRLLAEDRADTALGTGDHQICMARRKRGDADDVELFVGEHRSPIGMGPRVGSLSESFSTSGITAAAGDQLHSRMIRECLTVVAVEILHALPEAVARDLIAAADESETDDSRAVCWVTHSSLSIAGMAASFYREPLLFDQSEGCRMSESNPQAEDDCPLLAAQQARNIFCFAGFWCLFYLVAPVSYVGLTHANLLKDLGNSDTIANLPHAVYQWLTALPIVVAWFLPQPKMLKPLLVYPLILMAAVTGAVALAIWLKLSASVVTTMVITHGAVLGMSNGVLLTTLWEVLRRGVSTSRRGHALGVTFGVGPLFACVGSLAQQALFAKNPIAGMSLGLAFPQNYLVLFAAAAPLMLLLTVIAASFVVPLPTDEPTGQSRLTEILGGLRDFFTYRPLIFGAVGYFLVYSGGNAIFDNVSLHAKDVLGETSASSMGTQQFLRFGFKAFAGVFLGWLLTKTNPKTMLLTTTMILVLGMCWVLNVTGSWYLMSFGLLGAGELFGVYFPNYIATSSSKSQVRANMAYLSLLGSLVGFASVIFGLISDRWGRIASFHTAMGILLVAMVLMAVVLPARPAPQDSK